MADEPTPASPSSETPPPRTTGGNFRWEPPTAEELQKLMPGYTIEKILGRGGMGAVYRGVQTNLDRPVAIKILPPGVEKEDPSFAERFKSEARLMARLSHPAVVAVYDFGTNAGGQLYFAMEYVDGSDVSQMIAAQGKLPPEHALAITAHVCDALAAAHELGIVHRDIKPANVLLNMKGQVKVADFGLAKVEDPSQHGLTKTGYAMGTPDFVAPEALTLGTAIDGRADLYAVGVMLYQMLTGNIPRGAFKPASVLVPGLDPRFDPIILKAMQHDREERHQNAAELRRELDVILTVPFVRNDAPVSAAIPVAQIAQAPGQRSAAQRPQQRSAGSPTRQPSFKAGEGTRAPETPPKSKAPLFLGLGVAAAIGIGAFVTLRSGSRETSAERPQASASSSKPSGTLTSSATSKVSTPPKPVSSGSHETSAERPPAKTTVTSSSTKSSSPPPKPQPSEPQFPPGKWVKVFTKSEDLPEELRDPKSKRRAKWDAGWIQSALPGVQLNLAIPSTLSGNYVLRARFRPGANGLHGIFLRRQAGDNSGLYQLRLSENTLSCQRRDGARYHLVSSGKDSSGRAAGDEFTLEFAALGSKFYGRLDSHLLCVGTDATHPSGVAGLYVNDMAVRDIEVINLDGLSEAEALKILGVDEKGNDLRQPASVAATAPAPAVSKSPPLPISSSSDKFPPGQWVKVFDNLEEMSKAGVTAKDKEISQKDGWFVPSMSSVDLRLNQHTATNLGIRAKFKPIPERISFDLTSDSSNHRCTFHRAAATIGLTILRHSSINTAAAKELFTNKMDIPSQQGDSIFEYAHVEGRYIGRLNEKLAFVVMDQKRSGVRPSLYYSGAFRDIEVINLDGLPEAEALRLLGVDEKGNDLRALAAQQEQQKAEMAQQADAMAAIPELKTLHEQFVKLQAERVTAPFEAEVAKLNAGYVGGIDREIANEKKAGHLDGVIALEAEKKLIADKQPIPAEDEATTTDALTKLRGIYRAAYAKIEAARAENLNALTGPLDNRLKQLEATLTQQDRIAHAKTVREYREGLGRAAGPPAAVAKPQTALGGPSALPVAIPKGTRSKPDPEKSRQAVEYALGKGCEVSIDREGQIIPIKKLEDLPKGRWGLHRVKFLTPVTDEDLQAVTRAVELKEFACNDRVSAGTFTSLAPLGNTPELTILNLHRADPEFSVEDAQALRQSAETLKQLTWLTVNRNDALLSVLTVCQNLDYLYLNATELTDDDMDHLRTLPLLRSLNFRGSKLTDAGARHLAKFKPLARLMITDSYESGVTPLTPEGLAAITKTHGDTLIQLNIGSHGSPHTEGMLRVIAEDCPVVENLTLRGEASPEALAGLSKLKKLKQLDFGRVTGKPVPLSVAHCQAISSIKSLVMLGVNDCALTDEHVQALAGLKSVKSFNMNRNPAITDASVPVLLGFPDLEGLAIGGSSLSHAGILKLTALKKLKSLTIAAKDLTDAQVAQFKATLPGCSITR